MFENAPLSDDDACLDRDVKVHVKVNAPISTIRAAMSTASRVRDLCITMTPHCFQQVSTERRRPEAGCQLTSDPLRRL